MKSGITDPNLTKFLHEGPKEKWGYRKILAPEFRPPTFILLPTPLDCITIQASNGIWISGRDSWREKGGPHCDVPHIQQTIAVVET